MSNYFAWANTLLGGADPYQEEIDYAENAKKRNRTALGLDENGNPLPPNQPAQSAAAGQAAAAGVMPPAQQPNATKTDPALGHVLVDLQQYQEREQGFEQALGGIGAAVSQPRNREWVKGLFNTTPPDPIKSVQAQMDLAGQQQSQDRMNALGFSIQDPKTALQIAQSLHMPGATPEAQIAALQAAYRANPQAISQMLTQTQQPTPAIANLDQITQRMQLQDQYAKTAKDPKADPTALHSIRNQILASVAGTEAAPMVAAQLDYVDRHGVLPPWHDDLAQYKQHVADQASLSTEVQDAAGRHSSYIKQATQFSNLISDIKSDPALDTLLSTPGEAGRLKRAAAQVIIGSDPNTPIPLALKALPPDLMGVTFNDKEQELLGKMREAGGKQYGAALKSIGLSKPTGAEAAAIDKGLSQVNYISPSADAYRENALNPLGDLIDTQIGTSYGLSHNLKTMPARWRTYVPPEYLEGGTRHLENYPSDGSGEWGKSMSMDDADQAAANDALRRRVVNPDTGRPYTRYEFDQYLRKKGKRPNY